MHYLLNITHKELQGYLPDNHPLKSINADYGDIKESTEQLKKELGVKGKITKIDFSGETFEGIIFEGETKKKIEFSNFIFPVETDFSNTKFLKDTLFTNAVFLETANFEKAEFHKQPKTYKETAKFKDAVFMKVANFNKAVFNAYANFKGAIFSGRTIFQQAKFEYHAPRFYGTTFNNEMILNRIELPTAKKTKLHPIVRDKDNKNDTENEIYQKTVEENKSAYETLIYLMEKQNKYHDQHRFFREEMRWRQVGNILTQERRRIESRESLDKKYSFWLWLENIFTIIFFWLYDNVADYGYGIGRVFIWWLGHILIGALFIAIFTSCGSGKVSEILSCSIPVSLANANPVAFIGFEGGSLMKCYETLQGAAPYIFGIIRVTQTVLGIALLFLFLTTLRVRFRLK